jgi:hypothetical protein
MADVTTRWQIPLFDDDSPVVPIQNPLNAQSQRLEAVLNQFERLAVPPVADAAARNSLFPTPANGNRCFRLDMGWEEAYFTADKLSIGAAGWYPVAGKMPAIEMSRNEISTGPGLPNNGWYRISSTLFPVARNHGGFTESSGEVTLPYDGTYLVEFSALIQGGGSATGQRRGVISAGSAGSEANHILSIAFVGATDTTVSATAGIPLSKGTAVNLSLFQSSGGSANLLYRPGRTFFRLRYMGPV